ncbi:hypothetical protein C0J52_18592 [Blattella germanica]|nr:hypothetical protein C0J52_18592 [Blattella germanica]
MSRHPHHHHQHHRYPSGVPPQQPQQLRNPWISEHQESHSHSTNSSSSSRTYPQQPRGPGPPAQLWRVEAPISDRERPVTPASSPGATSGSAVDGCGGHCVAFENFCYYCLQVIFIAGILTGVSLTIAGGVLRGQSRGGDLLVLVYIGCMIAMVCTLLLSVQCCVRRNVKRRKRALRAAREQRRQTTDMIPLQDLTNQYQPLLVRLVQQQQPTIGEVHPPPQHQPKYR